MLISGCILTFNSERSLSYACESISQNVDELIIVDSGSTDKTLEIASQFTQKIYFNSFQNYASQRNFGINQCHGEYIFMLDSDEIVGKNFSFLPQILKKNIFQSIAFPRYHLVSTEPATFLVKKPHYYDWQTRLFKNNKKSQYSGAIHEQLSNYRPRLKLGNVHIFHLDFLLNSKKARQQKSHFYQEKFSGGYNRFYVFEEENYKTCLCREEINSELLSKLQNNKNFLHYALNHSAAEQVLHNLKFHSVDLLNKLLFTNQKIFDRLWRY